MVTRGLNAIGTCLILFIMVIVCADILGRYGLNMPIQGVAEMVTMSIVAIVFLQFPHTLRTGAVIRSKMFIDRLYRMSPTFATALDILFCVLGALAFAAIIYASIPFLVKEWRENDIFGVPGIFTFPRWPVRGITIFGSAMMVIQFLALAWAYKRKLQRATSTESVVL